MMEVANPNVAEVWVLGKALSWLKTHKLFRPTVESDCVEALEAIRSDIKV